MAKYNKMLCNIEEHQHIIDGRAIGDAFYVEMALFFILGVIGNLIVLLVYSLKRRKKPSTLLILALGITDFITCLTMIPLSTTMEYFTYQVPSEFLCKTWLLINTSMVPFSAFTMSLIAIERYLVICHPFGTNLTGRQTKIILSLLAVFALVSGIFVCLFHSIYQRCPEEETLSRDGNQTWFNSSCTTSVNCSNIDEFNSSYRFMARNDTHNIIGNDTDDINKEWFIKDTGVCTESDVLFSYDTIRGYKYFHLTMYFLSLFITVVLYILIFYYVYHNRRNMRHMSQTKISIKNYNARSKKNKQDPQNRRLTFRSLSSRLTVGQNAVEHIKMAFMLSMVALVFFLSFLIPTLHILRAINISKKDRYLSYLYYFNNVANPYIYSIMNARFRQDMMVKIHRRCKPRRSSVTSDLIPCATTKTIGSSVPEDDGAGCGTPPVGPPDDNNELEDIQLRPLNHHGDR